MRNYPIVTGAVLVTTVFFCLSRSTFSPISSSVCWIPVSEQVLTDRPPRARFAGASRVVRRILREPLGALGLVLVVLVCSVGPVRGRCSHQLSAGEAVACRAFRAGEPDASSRHRSSGSRPLLARAAWRPHRAGDRGGRDRCVARDGHRARPDRGLRAALAGQHTAAPVRRGEELSDGDAGADAGHAHRSCSQWWSSWCWSAFPATPASSARRRW